MCNEDVTGKNADNHLIPLFHAVVESRICEILPFGTSVAISAMGLLSHVYIFSDLVSDLLLLFVS